MRVIVDKTVCVASGVCVFEAPDVFAQDPVDGLARVLQEYPDGRLAEGVLLAESMCPSGAIVVESEGVEGTDSGSARGE